MKMELPMTRLKVIDKGSARVPRAVFCVPQKTSGRAEDLKGTLSGDGDFPCGGAPRDAEHGTRDARSPLAMGGNGCRGAFVATLAMLCGSLLHAENTEIKDPAAHSVIVPYDIAQPLDLKKSNRFYLDYAEFQRLWELAKENRRPAKPEAETGPQEAIIISALYEAEVLADRFVMKARLSVVTRGGPWVKLPLGFKADGLSVSEVTLDGKAALFENGEVLVEQSGSHAVEVSLEILKTMGWSDLSLALPHASAGLIALTTSEKEGRPSFGNAGMVTEESREGHHIFTLPLGSNATLDLKRQPFRKLVADTAPASAESRVTVSVLPRLEKASAEMSFAFPGTERSRFTVRLDSSWKPVSWDIPNLREWTLRKEGKDLLADITLTRAVADEFKMWVLAERVFAEATGSREAALISGEAVKKSVVFGIQHSDDFQVTAQATTGVQRANGMAKAPVGMLGSETYRLQNEDKLSYTITRAEDRSSSHMEAVYQLSAQKAEIIAAITLETGPGPLTEARISLPSGFEVQSLTGPRLVSWHRQADELSLRFDAQAVTEARLVLHVAKTLTKATSTWKLEPIKLPSFTKLTGAALIASHAADEVSLSFDASDRKLHEVDPAALNAVITVAPPLVMKRALTIDKKDWTAQVTLNRQAPKFSVDAVLLTQATDEGLKLSQQIGLNIEQGAVGGVKLRLPKDLPEARVRGALVRDAQSKITGEVREYEVKFQEDVLDRADFTLDLELPLEGEKTLPVVMVEGASRAQRFLIVDNASSREMKTDTGGAESIVKDSLPYLPDGLQRPQYYRAGDMAKIKLGFNQLETTAGNAAIITLAEITTALRQNGERWETVVYSIANRALQFLPVRLPARAELVEVSVGGQSVRADIEGSKKEAGLVYLVPLIQMRAGELSQQVRLVYRLPADTKSVVANHKLDDPELVGLSAERTLWNVWVPEAYELKKWDGNVEEVSEEGREVEKQQSLISDLSRLNRVLSSKDLKAEDANVAWANANKVVGELKQQQIEKKSKRSYFSRSDDGRAKELPQTTAQSFAIADAEVEKQLDVQGSLLTSNSGNVQRAQSQTEQGLNTFAGTISNGTANNWAMNGGNVNIQPKSEAKPADVNQLAVNDNVNIGQGFFDDKGAAAKKSEPQGAVTSSGAGTLTLGTGGIIVQNSNQTQGNTYNNARASKSNAINTGGTLDLNGINTYTGGTTINGGTLNIAGGVSSTARNIEVGQAKLELGDLDGAKKEFENALRIDKDNKAARRGMETAEQLTSDYSKTARDQTRGKMLNSVSEGWEEKAKPQEQPSSSSANRSGSYAITPDSIDGLLSKNVRTNSPAPAAADPFSSPVAGNSTLNSLAMDSSASTALQGRTSGSEARKKAISAMSATPQLKPVGRVSLAVEVPLVGTVYHFRKLKDHALIELTLVKPMEARQTNALWMLLIGGVMLSGVELVRRKMLKHRVPAHV